MSGPAQFLEPTWDAPPGVHALCTTKSAGSLDQLQNRVALPRAPQWLKQVHGIEVADLDEPAIGEERVADAAITSNAGVVCVVKTADCLPVLLAAVDGSVVGAAHAGWRGLAAGILEATVSRMRQRQPAPSPLMAWLGPAISAAHFEVGQEVRDAFVARHAAAANAFIANARGRWQCDLYQLARQRLAELGIDEVTGGEHCSYAEPERFHSHRRDVTRRGAADTGRMASLIWRD